MLEFSTKEHRMSFAKKVVVAVDLNNDSTLLLTPLREMEFLLHSEVHFVHVFNTVNYSVFFSEFPMVYPLETDRKVIREAVISFLTLTAKEVLPKAFSGKIIYECFFDESPKAFLSEYVKNTNIDLVIVPTRVKRGIFESSFAQYVSQHTNANMIFLK